MEKEITVIAADDHELMRKGFETMFREYRAVVKLLATAKNGEELLQLVSVHQPNVVITDIKMPVMDGIKVTAIIKRAFPQIKVIALTAFDESHLIEDMTRAGATGFALKTTPNHDLLRGIKEVNEGKIFYCHETEAKLFRLNEPPKSPVDFTPREIDVMRLMSQGYTNREMSDALGIGLRTIETHRANIYKKTGAKTAMAVALFAKKYGL